ncbi:hypothetical protein M4I33_15800 [Clostridium sp. LY3-2]|uniref:hypothetical protein n=1 Tax=Clostridium sp. LY3-2 TaxID=2942482 RepID=UPI0021527EF9|nr:hypothetical protein [Clostridium sp. LY3-2]MCR6516327.1 hypothetical protein [Clostridium sp. LY3-2]
MAKDVGNAVDHNIIVNYATLYWGDFSTVSATAEFVKSLDGKELGVSKEKVSVSTKPKIRQMKNAADKELGWQSIDQWEVKVTADMLDFDAQLLDASLFKSDETGTKFEAIQGIIPITSYKTLLIVGENVKGEPVIVEVSNTYNSEGLSFDCKNRDEAGIKVNFTGAYSGKKECPVIVHSLSSLISK